jgi:hypothetical protein
MVALVDTGSTVNVVSESVARQLVELGAQALPAETPLDLGGTLARVHSSHVLRLEVGTHGAASKKMEVDFVVLNTTFDGILGYSAVKGLGLVTLNTLVSAPSIQGILDEFADLFTDDISTAAKVAPFSIELNESRPIFSPPRRQPIFLQAVASEQVRSWLEQGVIRKSTSPFNNRVVMARKKDGSYRICLDFRALNQQTVPAPFPLPNIGSILERLRGSKYFCRLDLSSGFLQVPMAEGSIAFTAFSTEDGHFEFLRMPFGVTNAPLHFQAIMVDVLSSVLHNGVEDYMDDVLIHSPTYEGLCKSLCRVLELLRNRGLKLNKKKCLFGVQTIDFLGHTVSESGIAVCESRKESLSQIPDPTTVKQLRQLLGAWNYVRDHIPAFASVAAPLFALLAGRKTTKSHPLVWTPQAREALSTLRSLINDVPLLHFVDPELPLYLETDASDIGIGAVLFQEDSDGKKKVIAYVSSAFRGPSLRWTVMEKEAFALYFAVNKLRHFLLGRRFVIRSDCKNLLFGTSLIPKIQRWTLRLQEFDFEIQHIRGQQNVVADSLSRLNLISDAHVEAIRQVHGGFNGHHGAIRTVQFLKDLGITWDSMSTDVAEYVSNCFVCAKMKRSASGLAVAAGTTMTDAPFKVVSMD